MRRLKVLALCDGISCGLMAFKALGLGVEYHAVEIDKYCRDLSDENFGDEVIRWENDVDDITKKEIVENGPFDWVLFGSPCQSVSTAGNRKGLVGKSGLLTSCLHVLRWCQSENPKLKYLIENVRMSNNFKDQFTKLIGHEPVLIDSKDFSCQKRRRFYWCNFKAYSYNNTGTAAFKALGINVFGWSKSTRYKKGEKVGSAPGRETVSYIEERLGDGNRVNTLNTGVGCRGQSTVNYVIEISDKEIPRGTRGLKSISFLPERTARLFPENITADAKDLYYRYLTVGECAKIQQIPDSFKFPNESPGKSYRAIGNGWTIGVIKHLISSGENLKDKIK